MHRPTAPAVLALVLAAAACRTPGDTPEAGEERTPTAPAPTEPPPPQAGGIEAAPQAAPGPAAGQAQGTPTVESSEVLAREPVTAEAAVKHVLIAWADLAPAFRGGINPRAVARSQADADRLALEIAEKARSGADFDALMREHSEDPGSAAEATAYTVTADAPFVPSFKAMALRLKPGEVGIVRSPFGWHVMKRTA